MLAHIHLEGAVVTVNIPICFFCIASLARDNPYNSVAGMKAVVRALQERGPVSRVSRSRASRIGRWFGGEFEARTQRRAGRRRGGEDASPGG